MKKKILTVMLSAVLTVTMLVGCGDSMETGRREEIRKDRGHKETHREEQETEKPVESKWALSICCAGMRTGSGKFMAGRM